MNYPTTFEAPGPDTASVRSRILCACAEGSGFPGIMKLAYEVLRTDMALCSTSLSVLCCYPPDRDSFFYENNNGDYCPRDEGIRDFFASGNPQRIMREPDTPFLARYRDTDQIHLFCGVRVRQTIAAYLCIIWNREDLPEEIFEFVRFLSRIMSIELQRQGFENASFFDREIILTELINGHTQQLQSALERFPMLTHRPAFTYRLCIASSYAADGSQNDAIALRKLFAELYPNAICHISGAELLLLMPDFDADPVNSVVMRLTVLLKAYRFTLSCSNPMRDLSLLPVALRQVRALSRSADVAPGEPIRLAERCLPVLAFHSAYPNAVTEAWIHPHIQRFLLHDRAHNTAFTDTLTAYLRCGRSMQAAADALFIHKTTLIYRLNRMQELTVPFLKDPGLLFLYEYALRLMGML